MQTIDPDLTADAKLRAYVDAHRRAFQNSERICLAAALAADIASLPPSVRQSVQDFYRANEDWLARVLEQGILEGNLRVQGDPRTAPPPTLAAQTGHLIVRTESDRVGKEEIRKGRLARSTTH